ILRNRLDHQSEFGLRDRRNPDLGARRQVRPRNTPERIPKLYAAATVTDRFGQSRGAADQLVAATVEKRLVGIILAWACQPPASEGGGHGQDKEQQHLRLPRPETRLPGENRNRADEIG